MKLFQKTVCTALIVACAGCATTRELRIAEGGVSGYQIVIAADATPSTQYGAEELQRFLGEITGSEIVIVTDDAPIASQEIVLGDSAHLRAILPDTDAVLEGLGDEGYIIRQEGKHLIIAGGELRGNLYGVYGLLEDHLGCRWFTPDVSHIPKSSSLRLPPIDERVIPAVESREPFTADCRDGDWCARNRMNSSAASLEEKHGGKVRFGAGLFVHTFNVLMPPDEFFDEHPEYYSLIDGERVKDRSQLCCSNEDVIRICTERMLDRIASDPDAYVYSLSQNDWINYCECGPCTEIADREGTQMGPVLHLVNRVAEAVEQEYPDKYIETLAYQYTREAPAHMRPRDNVIIRLCSIECDFMQPLATSDDEANQLFVRDLKAWAQVSDRLWIWDYVTSFRSYLCPFPNLRVRDDNIQLFVANNVTGIFEQDVYNTLHGELSPLSGYLNAKLLWDPYYDEDTAINEFLNGVYGDAAPHIQEYIDMLHNHVSAENIHAGIWIGPRDAPFLNDEILAKADAIWDEAEAAVAANAEVLERVQTARLSVDYAIIDRANTTGLGGYRVDHETFTAEVDPALRERVQRFFDHARRAGVTRMDENRTSLDQYEEQHRRTLQEEPVTFTPRVADVVSGLRPGLTYEYHEGAWDMVPDFDALEGGARGHVATVDIAPRERDENYAMRFQGYINVPRDGLYTFYLQSNDGSRLWIGPDLIVDNDGLHSLDTRGGIAALRAGHHPITVEYFQAGMNYGLKLEWKGPGFEKGAVSEAVLFSDSH